MIRNYSQRKLVDAFACYSHIPLRISSSLVDLYLMDSKRPIRQIFHTREQLKTQAKAMDFMLNLALGAITLLFVGLTFAYTFGRRLSDNWVEFSLPKAFWLSTLLLAGCSYAIHRGRLAYEHDEVRQLKQSLGAAFWLGAGFIASQYLAWRQLADAGIGLSGNPSGSYLYIISWLHAGHIVLGLILLAVTLQTARKNTRDEVQALLYFSDPVRNRRLKMVSLYWHVVDGLWLYLFVFFLFFHS
jgi:cytochrome c oxidase subunit III